MYHEERTGRPARGTPSPLSPNEPRIETPRPRIPDGVLQGLPPGARLVGRVRVPLTLTVAPWASLYRLHDGPPIWRVRLPTIEGAPVWRTLSRTEPIRWAIASRLPLLAREATRLLAAVEAEAGEA